MPGPRPWRRARASAGRTHTGRAAQSASFGLALAATSSAREVGPAPGSSRRVRSASLASSEKWHATKILKADHDVTAARNAATASWPWNVAAARAMTPVVGRLGDRPAVAGQPPHHRDVALLRRGNPERGVSVPVRLGDRPAVAGQPPHHLEMAIIRRDQERGSPVVGRLGDRPAVAGQSPHHLEMAKLRRTVERGSSRRCPAG